MKKVFCFLQGVVLSGCSVVPHPNSDYFQNKYWTKGREQPMQMVYCYSTLGDHQCTREPIPGKEHLLVSDQALMESYTPDKKLNNENIQKKCINQEQEIEEDESVASSKICPDE